MIQKRRTLEAIFESTIATPCAPPTIEIHNMRTSKPYRPYDVRCDKASPLGNAFWHNREAERDRACDDYQAWFDREVVTHHAWPAFEELMRLRALYREHGRLRIFCWCQPKRCHTETIMNWLLANV